MYATYSNSIPCMIMYSLFIFTTPILMQKEDSFPVALCVVMLSYSFSWTSIADSKLSHKFDGNP